VISYRNLAQVLGCSYGTVVNRVRAGMPPHDTAAARAWCANLPARKKFKRRIPEAGRHVNGDAPANGHPSKRRDVTTFAAIDTSGIDIAGETLASTIPRLRSIERAIHDALTRSINKDPCTYEAGLLRLEHLKSIRALYDYEAKLIRIDAAREKLISIDRVHSMISGALRVGAAVMGRLPELGVDEDDRRRLEEFATAVLKEFEFSGAGLNGVGIGGRRR
jgi:hypothetical protein